MNPPPLGEKIPPPRGPVFPLLWQLIALQHVLANYHSKAMSLAHTLWDAIPHHPHEMNAALSPHTYYEMNAALSPHTMR